MVFTSHAQNFEDVLLWRVFEGVERGRYVDVGAQHPTSDSVSYLFYSHGWRGIHVEANAHYAQLLREARPDETVIHAAVATAPGPLTFFEIADTGLSTARKDIANFHDAKGFKNRRTEVATVRLSTVLDMVEDDIHWLKVDVEGMEADVLESWDASTVRPWVLVVEATFPNGQEQTHDEWIGNVLGRGYIEVYFDGLSRYFVHETRRDLAKAFSVPPNVFDDFRLTRDHFAARQLVDDFASEMDDLHRRAAETAEGYAQEREHLQSDIDALQSANSKRREEIEGLHAELQDLHARAAEAANAFDGERKQILEFLELERSSSGKLREQLAAVEGEASALQQRADEAARLREQLAAVEEAARGLQRRADEAAKSFEAKLESVLKALDAEQSRLSVLEAEGAKERREFRGREASWLSTLSNMASQIERAGAEERELRESLSDLTEQNVRCEAEISSLDAMLRESRTDLARAARRSSTLLANQRQLMAQVTQELDRCASAIEDLRRRSSPLSSLWARLRGDAKQHDEALLEAVDSVRALIERHQSSVPGISGSSKMVSRSSERQSLEKESGFSKRAIFTIVSNNYLHFARTLLQSVREFHPESDLFCVIVDSDISVAEELGSEFTAIRMTDLPLPLGEEFIFQYNVLELNTAVKPWSFEHLMDQGYDEVIYIDPDIRLYRPLTDVVDALADGQDIVLTPHLLAPMTDDLRPTELDIRRAGTYNFGFCALRTTDNSRRFLAWWQSKLERECIIALDRGIFVDQSWMDFVPGMFERVFILRHPGYNVAYWNLAQRETTQGRSGWTVNGEPLVFFHYSGLNPLNPKPFSKHQNRFTIDDLGPVRKLVDAYVAELIKNGVRRYSEIPYGFGRFEDGESVPSLINALYREDDRLKEAFGARPFANSPALLKPAKVVDGEEVSWAMLAVWQLRPDLQAVFPLATGQSVHDYRAWFAHEGANYYSPKFVEFERERVLSRPAPESGNGGQAPEEDAVQQVGAVSERPDLVALQIQSLFYTVLGRFAEQEAIETYRRVMAKSHGSLRVWKALAKSKENRLHPGWVGRAMRGLGVALEKPRGVPGAPQAIAGGNQAEKEAPALASPDVPVVREWFEERLDRLAARPAPFWLHLPDPDSKDLGQWTTSTIRLRLPADSGSRKLRIEGWFPADLVNQQSGQKETTIAAFLAGRMLARRTLSANGNFVIEGDLPGQVGERPNVYVLSEHHFVPQDIGLNDDTRELAIRLRRVTVGDTVIFDSSLENPEPFKGSDLYDPPGINLVGFVKAELGIGEAARSLALAAHDAAIDYSLIDVGYQSINRQTDDSASAHATSERQPVDIICVNAGETPTTLRHLETIGHSAKLRIGFWHWEQPLLPEKFLASFSGLDEIWAPTSFVQEAVSALSPIPVAKIPDAVHFEIPNSPSRKRFGLPARKFLALVMYDFASYQYRKNPQAAVEAFRRAAAGRKDATLVIKTINAGNHAEEFSLLQQSVADLPSVVFLTEFLSRKEVYELQACCDVLLSLHRAEGFGLAPAEMMFLGKPVIATGWSGNMDFMTPMNSYPVKYDLQPLKETHGVYEAGPVWAEADIDHAAWCLRDVMDDRAKAKALGKKAALDIRETHSPAAVGREMRKRLNLLADLPAYRATNIADAVKSSHSDRAPDGVAPAGQSRLETLKEQHARSFAQGAESEIFGPDDVAARIGSWVGQRVALDLPSASAKQSVKIVGWYPGSQIETMTGDRRSVVAAFCNDTFLGSTELSDDGEFTLTFDLPSSVGRTPQLFIVSDRSFRPSQVDGNSDDRELALRLRKVEVGGTTLFDSSCSPQIVRDADELHVAPGINLIGYVKAEMGVGEGARAIAACATAADIPYTLVDVSFQSGQRQTDDSAVGGASAQMQPIDLMHVNADQTATVARYAETIKERAAVRIGYWAWEQPQLPKLFLDSFRYLDEVWTPSSFVQKAVSEMASVPVLCVPHSIEFTVPKKPNRAKFGLPDDKFLVLVMYDFHSYSYRKNPQAAVEAYRKASKGRKDTALVLKTTNAAAHQEDLEQLKESLKDLQHVVFIDQFLSRQDVYELQACCDTLVSLHRAEGFGLAPAEMMYLGKPVVATGWSGNMDYMTCANSYPVDFELKPLEKALGPYEAGPVWAEADISHAAACLRKILDDPAGAKALGKKAAADIRDQLSPKAVGELMRRRLAFLARTHRL